MRNFSFNQMSDAELFISTGVIVQRCEDNRLLTSLNGQFEAVRTTFFDFSEALVTARKEAADALPIGDTRRSDLIAALDNLEKCLMCLSPEAAPTDSPTKNGFDIFNAFFAPPNVPAPTHIAVHNAACLGYVRVSWRIAMGAILYLVEHRRQGDTVWKSSGHTTYSLILLSGFERGTYVEFRLCTLGRDQLRSSWTEPVCLFVA